MRFRDIPQYTRAHYSIAYPWGDMERWLTNREWNPVDLNPDFQREHVWSREQQISFVEFSLRGGESGRNIYFNCAGYDGPDHDLNAPIEVVDGKQRLTAARAFMAGDIPAFGYTINQFEDRMPPFEVTFRFHINDLQTRAEVIQWYLDLNYRGTPHTDEELQRVMRLLEEAKG